MRPHLALIDGRDMPDGLTCPARAIIDGDALSLSIAAASIIAKTARDALMRNLHVEYPGYGFADHVGYATAAHRRALIAAGPCPYHRRSFRLREADAAADAPAAARKGLGSVEAQTFFGSPAPYENDTTSGAAG